eukprot:365802-Chlamydomonas_euryale.AAC.23
MCACPAQAWLRRGCVDAPSMCACPWPRRPCTYALPIAAPPVPGRAACARPRHPRVNTPPSGDRATWAYALPIVYIKPRA